MKRRNSKLDRSSNPPVSSAREGASGRAQAEQRSGDANRDGLLADQSLVERCLAGEVAAWEGLYSQCHDRLLVSIKVMLARHSSDPNLADEIAARVWYALVANDGEILSKYDSGRGARLVTFMRALAKDEVSRHFRAERRRRDRELLAVRENPRRYETNNGPITSSLGEFLATLTPHERCFAGEYLLAERSEGPERPAQSQSSANVWQLSRRIYRKLLGFLRDNQ